MQGTLNHMVPGCGLLAFGGASGHSSTEAPELRGGSEPDTHVFIPNLAVDTCS
jgi:hypothetical protein